MAVYILVISGFELLLLIKQTIEHFIHSYMNLIMYLRY